MAKKNGKAVAERPENTGAIAPINEDVTDGGISASDFEIGRALILQSTSPDVQEKNGDIGTVINNISKELLGKYFIPMLAFKQYAEFEPDNGPMKWSTRDRTDPRVVEGLKWVDSNKPVVTEFINLFVVFTSDESNPVVLSFKRGSMKAGKNFLTLMEMKRRAKNNPKKWHECVYRLDILEKMKGTNKYYTPKVLPTSEEKDGAESKVSPELLVACKQFAEFYGPTFKNMDVAGDSKKVGDSGDESFQEQF